ncbi:MAG: RraA family protein [Candidatus Kaistia colombiensis]|nr:MAG: RraA family protein [Kaistia sp.]
MTDLTARLEACYTGVVHDVMRAMGLRDFTLPAEMRPIMPERSLAGPAFTIEGRADPDADGHETLLAWTGLLSKAPAGSIWVSQPNDRIVAHMGELSAETLKNKGVRGAIVDGFVRDTNFLLEMGFQTWCRGFTPRDIVGHWLPVATEVPIVIGGIDVRPGDYFLGDRDGLVRIPAEHLLEVVERAETAITTESLVRKAILAGTDPQQAYLKHGKF